MHDSVIIIQCGCGQHPLAFFSSPPRSALAAAAVLAPSPLRQAYERGLRDQALISLHAQFLAGVLGGSPA